MALWVARERRNAAVTSQQEIVRQQMREYQHYSNSYANSTMNGTISTNAASLHGIGGMTWNELALNDTAVAMHRNEVVNDFRAHGNILAWKKNLWVL